MRNHRILKTFFITFVMAMLALSVSISAQGQETKKGKKSKSERIAEIQETPPSVQVETKPAATPANGSLYVDEAANGNLLTDFKARRVGDLVFIDVVEASVATVESSAKRGRDSGTLGGLVGAIGALPVPGATVVGGVVGGLGSRKYEGKGSTERQSSLKARIVARVTEVLPNGDLRVTAVKTVKINKENEQLALSGIVRQKDVSADNSIPTTFVGELQVALNGKGVASADNAPGWLFRLFEKISPF
jgi:flagellar L-ring protein FlgH